jgi:hypothetical protein
MELKLFSFLINKWIHCTHLYTECLWNTLRLAIPAGKIKIIKKEGKNSYLVIQGHLEYSENVELELQLCPPDNAEKLQWYLPCNAEEFQWYLPGNAKEEFQHISYENFVALLGLVSYTHLAMVLQLYWFIKNEEEILKLEKIVELVK